MAENGAFVRSTSMPKRVWLRHKSFRVEDIPDDRWEDAIQHMLGNYFLDEPLACALQKTSPFSEDDMRGYVTNGLKNNLSIFAVDEDNNDKIAGMTLIRATSRVAPNRYAHLDATLPTLKRYYDFIKHCYAGLDKFTYRSGPSTVVVDHVLEPLGLSVAREYRGKGVGQAIVRARHRMAVEAGMGATMGIYTSIYSQAILLNEGMETVKEVSHAEYLDNGVAVLAGLNPPHPSTKMIGGLLPKQSS